jgi:hypothetical protein
MKTWDSIEGGNDNKRQRVEMTKPTQFIPYPDEIAKAHLILESVPKERIRELLGTALTKVPSLHDFIYGMVSYVLLYMYGIDEYYFTCIYSIFMYDYMPHNIYIY